LTAEAVTLATAIVNRKLTADQMIDDGFNKHNFNHKDGLPTWFLDDEGKYYKPNLPVTKEAIQALRAKQRALDARPIKKVAEAKARKKMKASMRMEKAKRKMDGLTDAPDMNERDKATQMMKLLGKAAGKPKKKEVAVVVAKGVNRGVKGRPKGVKGRYKIVDPRMRKLARNPVAVLQSADADFCFSLDNRQGSQGTQENRQTGQEAQALERASGVFRTWFHGCFSSRFLVQIRGCSEYCCLISRIISFRDKAGRRSCQCRIPVL